MNYYYLLPKNDFFKRGYRGSVMHALGIIEGFNENGMELTVMHAGGLEEFVDQRNQIIAGTAGKKNVLRLLKDSNTRLLIRYSMSNLLYIVWLHKMAKNKRSICLEVNTVSKMYGNTHGVNSMVHLLEKLLIKKVEIIYVVSAAAKEFLIENLNVPAKNILVLPNALKGRKTSLNSHGEKSKGKESTSRIVYLGTLQPYYDVHRVCEWLEEYNKMNEKSIEFHFYGNDVKDQLQTLKKQYGNTLYINGRYKNDEIDKILDGDDILILPSNTDNIGQYGSPVKLFEYMSLKRPILASAVPQNMEILTHNHNALLYGSKEEFFKNLHDLTADIHLRNRLSETAYGEVVKLHTWKIRMKELMEFWN